MTNSNDTRQITQVVDELMAWLSEECLRVTIDQPIRDAALNHEPPSTGIISHELYHQAIAARVQALYAHGLRVPRRLLHPEALAEAITLLEQHPASPSSHGYETALLSVRLDGRPGLQRTLSTITEAVISRERSNYIDWSIAKVLAGRGFQDRCRVAEELLRRYGRWIPPQFVPPSPAWLGDEIPTLVTACLAAEERMHRCLEPSIFDAT